MSTLVLFAHVESSGTLLVPDVAFVDNPGYQVNVDVPRSKLAPPRLEWSAGPPAKRSPDIESLLQSFLNLRKAGAAKIASFAQQWGPLGITATGLPYSRQLDGLPLGADHRSWESNAERNRWNYFHAIPRDGQKRAAEISETITKTEFGDLVDSRKWFAKYWEPISAWNFYVDKIFAILALANELRQGRYGSDTLWLAALRWPRPNQVNRVRSYPSFETSKDDEVSDLEFLSKVKSEGKELLLECLRQEVDFLLHRAGVSLAAATVDGLPRLTMVLDPATAGNNAALQDRLRAVVKRRSAISETKYRGDIDQMSGAPPRLELFGNIVIQAMSEIEVQRRVAFCGSPGCGNPVFLKPFGQGRRATYCDECRRANDLESKRKSARKLRRIASENRANIR